MSSSRSSSSHKRQCCSQRDVLDLYGQPDTKPIDPYPTVLKSPATPSKPSPKTKQLHHLNTMKPFHPSPTPDTSSHVTDEDALKTHDGSARNPPSLAASNEKNEALVPYATSYTVVMPILQSLTWHPVTRVTRMTMMTSILTMMTSILLAANLPSQLYLTHKKATITRNHQPFLLVELRAICRPYHQGQQTKVTLLCHHHLLPFLQLSSIRCPVSFCCSHC